VAANPPLLPMSNMRVKLLVLPYEERLCILCKERSTIADLKASVNHAISFYSVYQEFLSFCIIHLEIQIDGALYGIPDCYVLRDVATSKDTFVVSFVDQQNVCNRRGIHIPAQSVADIQFKKMTTTTSPVAPNQQCPISLRNPSPGPLDGHSTKKNHNRRGGGQPMPSAHQTNHHKRSRAGPAPHGDHGREYKERDDGNEAEDGGGGVSVPQRAELDVSRLNIEEIRHWARMYMGSSATVHPAYHCPFSQLVDRLSGKFPKLRAVANWESFLTEHCLLSVATTTKGKVVQCEAVATSSKKENRKKKRNKNSQNAAKVERTPNPFERTPNPQQNDSLSARGGGGGGGSGSGGGGVSGGGSGSLGVGGSGSVRGGGGPPSKSNANGNAPAVHPPPPSQKALHPVLQDLPLNESVVSGAVSKKKTAAVAEAAAPVVAPSHFQGVHAAKPPLRAAPPLVIGHHPAFSKKKSTPKDLPTTPDSPSDDDEVTESLRGSAFPTPKAKDSHSPAPKQPNDDGKTESEEKNHERPARGAVPDAEVAPKGSPKAAGSPPAAAEEMAESVEFYGDPKAIEFVRGHLEDILVRSYAALSTPDCGYVVLSELERAMKAHFRDSTPHELDPTDLDYVNFAQLMAMEFAASQSISVETVCCDRKLICLRRGEEYVPKTDKIKKHGKEWEPCPEIETYVVVSDKATGSRLGAEKARSPEAGGDGDAPQSVDSLDERIRESISYLARCNVVPRLGPTDIYWHIKLIHSECSIRTLEAEFNGHVDRMASRGQLPQQNSFDEIAIELKQNGISGPRLLEMRWSDWEMLHELYRFDRDHQDFVDEILCDFFFPFLTAELLQNELAAAGKSQFARHCMFDSERVRPKLTLCVDYGLFAPSYPILHYLVKLADLDDLERLLRLHPLLSVDEVVGEYSAMHIAAWRGKFKLLAMLTKYGGDPLRTNAQGETAFVAGKKHQPKLQWFYSEFPQYAPE